MKKITALLLTVVLVAVVLSACGGKANNSQSSPAKAGESSPAAQPSEKKENVELTHFTWQVADAGDAFDVITKMYEDAHPHVTIDVQNVASDQYYSTLQARLLSGDAPDILTTGPGEAQYGAQARNGYLLDLTNEPMIQNIQPGILSSVEVDGKIYGIPNGIVSLVVLYNKKIFEENGIQVPTNYQEMLAACEQLKANSITPVAFGIKDGYVTQFLPYQIAPTTVYAKNPNWDADLAAGKVKFNSPEWKRTLEIPFEFLDKGYFTPNALGVGDQQSVEMFARGEAAMTFSGTWAIGTAKAANPDIEIGMFPFPANEPGEEQWMTVSIGSIMAISSSSKSIDEAKQYVEAWTTKAYSQIWTDKSKSTSTMKGVDNSFDPAMNDLSPYLEKLKTWRFANAGWPVEEITTVFMKKFQEAYAGKATVEDILKAMDNAVN